MGSVNDCLSWSVHHNFVCEGRFSERGWAFTPYPQQHGLIVCQKVAVSILCTLWVGRNFDLGAESRDIYNLKVVCNEKRGRSGSKLLLEYSF
jgi:hypothetical protein